MTSTESPHVYQTSGRREDILLKKAAKNALWSNGDPAGRIYRKAAEIMCRKGYEATSMNDIARAVGLTKAGIYHYIRGKEELLFAIMTYAMDMVDQDVIAPARYVEDAEDRLRIIVERHARRILDVGGAVTILLEEMYALTPAHRRNIRSRKQAYVALIRETVCQLLAEGKLCAIDPTVATFNILGTITFLARWYRRDGSLTPNEVLREVCDFTLNAVVSRKAIPARPHALGA